MGVRINPDQVHSREDLIKQLERLFAAGGWSFDRLANAAGLSSATIHSLIDGKTNIPRKKTLEKFVEACGEDPEPWLAALARIYQLAKPHTAQTRSRQSRAFWREFSKPNLTVVVGLHQLGRWEPSGLIGVGCAFALSELQQYFVRIGAPSPVITYGDRIKGAERRHPLILIGGPDSNGITDEVMQRLSSSLSLGFSRRSPHDVSLHDSQTDQIYAPELQPRGDEGTDYGLVVKTKNPFNPQVPVLVIAGSFGYGSWAAARHLTEATDEFAPLYASFECLLGTEVVDRTPQAINILALRKLDQAMTDDPLREDARYSDRRQAEVSHFSQAQGVARIRALIAGAGHEEKPPGS
ncbi:helix-turn-helix domain-containing protein [Streptomyces marianii]|uniref:Helix-turn-helix transcriptional regulator n=1 Tax=Streptomyces marianii TaxID=1817406 RepID=A0A5R9E091_9ACTN|nr:helix-turn-helix transcriptional regulator [Streptomyces marianii]TLQ43086.1 helix-turn-helix transcriptional regulator [Streptomyces marianii]